MRIALGIIGAALIVASIIFAAVDAKKEEKEEPPNKNDGLLKSTAKKIFKFVKKYYKSIILTVLSLICFLLMYISFDTELAATGLMYTVTKDAFSRYRSKNEDLSGKNYQEKVYRKSMQAAATKEEYYENGYQESGFGETLFYETISHEYFLCSFPKIREIEEQINDSISSNAFTPLSMLFSKANIKPGERIAWVGKALGWGKNEDMHFVYYPQIIDEDTKAVVIGFSVCPHHKRSV